MSIVDDRIAALKKRIALVEHIDFDGARSDMPNMDDRAFVAELKAILSEREVSLNELADLRKPHEDRRDAAFRAQMDRLHQQREPGPHNKLYQVANRAEMRIDVIAMDVATAQDFAVRAGHVRSADNATVSRYNEAYVEKLMKDGSALGRAVREGVPGVVEKRGKNVIIGDRVFTPMTVV